MNARQFSLLLYTAEIAPTGKQDLIEFAVKLDTPLDPDLRAFLAHLTDPNKYHTGLAKTCEIVSDNANLHLFWRALAAHHRALACQPSEDPDLFFPVAIRLINPIYSLTKAEGYAPTPEGSYIYHSRMRDRDRLKLMSAGLDMLILGAKQAIEEGWFEAPDWAHDVCDKLVADGNISAARALVESLMIRSQAPNCYFSRTAQDRLTASHGSLQAA